ncbi:MAG: group 1 truncated hemoglobin [Candidatus Sericytochromatia bacterium]
MKDYEKIGGLEKVKELVNVFVDRMVNDIMIGFFFSKVDVNRVKEKEFEFLANFLGADLEYSGKPIKEAHENHMIMGGQFSRRKQILKEVLEENKVDLEIINKIMEHTENFRMAVAKTKNSDCKNR